MFGKRRQTNASFSPKAFTHNFNLHKSRAIVQLNFDVKS